MNPDAGYEAAQDKALERECSDTTGAAVEEAVYPPGSRRFDPVLHRVDRQRSFIADEHGQQLGSLPG